jgi:hypothetical protein
LANKAVEMQRPWISEDIQGIVGLERTKIRFFNRGQLDTK